MRDGLKRILQAGILVLAGVTTAVAQPALQFGDLDGYTAGGPWQVPVNLIDNTSSATGFQVNLSYDTDQISAISAYDFPAGWSAETIPSVPGLFTMVVTKGSGASNLTETNTQLAILNITTESAATGPLGLTVESAVLNTDGGDVDLVVSEETGATFTEEMLIGTYRYTDTEHCGTTDCQISFNEGGTGSELGATGMSSFSWYLTETGIAINWGDANDLLTYVSGDSTSMTVDWGVEGSGSTETVILTRISGGTGDTGAPSGAITMVEGDFTGMPFVFYQAGRDVTLYFYTGGTGEEESNGSSTTFNWSLVDDSGASSNHLHLVKASGDLTDMWLTEVSSQSGAKTFLVRVDQGGDGTVDEEFTWTAEAQGEGTLPPCTPGFTGPCDAGNTITGSFFEGFDGADITTLDSSLWAAPFNRTVDSTGTDVSSTVDAGFAAPSVSGGSFNLSFSNSTHSLPPDHGAIAGLKTASDVINDDSFILESRLKDLSVAGGSSAGSWYGKFIMRGMTTSEVSTGEVIELGIHYGNTSDYAFMRYRVNGVYTSIGGNRSFGTKYSKKLSEATGDLRRLELRRTVDDSTTPSTTTLQGYIGDTLIGEFTEYVGESTSSVTSSPLYVQLAGKLENENEGGLTAASISVDEVNLQPGSFRDFGPGTGGFDFSGSELAGTWVGQDPWGPYTVDFTLETGQDNSGTYSFSGLDENGVPESESGEWVLDPATGSLTMTFMEDGQPQTDLFYLSDPGDGTYVPESLSNSSTGMFIELWTNDSDYYDDSERHDEDNDYYEEEDYQPIGGEGGGTDMDHGADMFEEYNFRWTLDTDDAIVITEDGFTERMYPIATAPSGMVLFSFMPGESNREGEDEYTFVEGVSLMGGDPLPLEGVTPLTTELVVGEWKNSGWDDFAHMDMEKTVTFNANGTGSMLDSFGGFDFNWTLNSGAVEMEMLGEDGSPMLEPDGTAMTTTIYALATAPESLLIWGISPGGSFLEGFHREGATEIAVTGVRPITSVDEFVGVYGEGEGETVTFNADGSALFFDEEERYYEEFNWSLNTTTGGIDVDFADDDEDGTIYRLASVANGGESAVALWLTTEGEGENEVFGMVKTSLTDEDNQTGTHPAATTDRIVSLTNANLQDTQWRTIFMEEIEFYDEMNGDIGEGLFREFGGWDSHDDSDFQAVSGTVTDSSGNPLENIMVAFEPEWDPDTGNWGFWEETFTDASGAFSVNLLAGRYRIRAESSYWNWRTNEQVNGTHTGGFVEFSDPNSGPITTQNDWNEADQIQVTATGEIKTASCVLTSDWWNSCLQNPESVTFTDFTGSLTIPMKAGLQITGTISGMSDGVQYDLQARTTDWTGWYHSDVTKDSGDATRGTFSITVDSGQSYVIEAWPRCWSWDDFTQTESMIAGCDQSQGGNFVADTAHASLITDQNGGSYDESDWDDRPTITVGVATGTISGTILPVWDDHYVTRFAMEDESLTLAASFDSGSAVTGQVKLSNGNPVRNAWINLGMVGEETDESGNFSINLPSMSFDDQFGGPCTGLAEPSKAFFVEAWPGWYDQYRMTEEPTSFMGGMVKSDGSGGYELSSQWGDWTTGEGFDAICFNKDAADPAVGAVDWPNPMVITVSQGVSITGTVTLNGSPVDRIWVDAWDSTNNFGMGDETNASGEFTIPVKPGNTYEVGLWIPDDKVADLGIVMPDRQTITVQEGGDNTVNFALESGGVLQGKIVNSDGEGVPWVGVEFYTPGWTRSYWVNSNERGSFSVSLEPGRYYAVVWGGGDYQDTWYPSASSERKAKLLTVLEDKSIKVLGETKDRIKIKMNSGITLSGTVKTPNTNPLGSNERIWINAWSDTSNSWGGTEVQGGGDNCSTVGAEYHCTYTIRGLTTAPDYKIDWWSDERPSGFYGGTPGVTASEGVSWEQATRISTVDGNAVTGVDIDLTAATTSLTVNVDGFDAGVCDSLDAGVWSESSMNGGWGWQQIDSGDTSKSVTINGLDPDVTDYRARVELWGCDYKSGHFIADGTYAEGQANAGTLGNWDRATQMQVSDGTELNVTVSSGGKIRGTVTGLSDNDWTFVDAWSDSTWSWAGREVRVGAPDVTCTDSGDGSYSCDFELSGLGYADDYRVSLWGDGVMGGFWNGGSSLTGWDQAALIEVSSANPIYPSASERIELPLQAGKSIAGTIHGMDQNTWAWVDAWSHNSWSWGGTDVIGAGETPSTDTYTIEGLASTNDFEVNLWADGYAPQSQRDVDTTPTNGAENVDFTVASGYAIKGSISGLDAYSTAWLDAWSPSTNQWSGTSVTADENGNVATYTLNDPELPSASDYVVAVWTDRGGFFYNEDGATKNWENHTAVVIDNADATDINIDIGSVVAYDLSGSISGLTGDDESAVVNIFAWSYNGNFQWTNQVGNGDFTLAGLPADDYVVEVVVEGKAPQRTDEVTVASGSVTSVTWTTDPVDEGTVSLSANTTGLDINFGGITTVNVSISGTVTDGTNAVEGAFVNAWSDGANFGGSDIADANGNFEIKGLVGNNTYLLETWTPSGKASVEVAVTDSDASQNLTVTKESGTITGSVTAGTSCSSEAGVYVFVFDENDEYVDMAVTDSDGGYTVDDLATDGNYSADFYCSDSDFTSSVGSTNGMTGESMTGDVTLQ